MYTVGDQIIHQRFLAALEDSHGYDGRVEAWYNGTLITQIEAASGIVKVNARNTERRSLEVTVSERLWPDLDADPLSPFGVWLRVFAIVTAGAAPFPEVPTFTGPLATVGGPRWSGQLTVKARDPFRQIVRESFETLRRAPAGVHIVDTIRILIVEVFPAADVIDLTGSVALVPESTAWDAKAGSRAAAIDDLAASIGAEVIALPGQVWPGGTFIIRPVPSLSDRIAWTLPDGTRSIVAADERSKSGDTIVNRWIVTSERTDTTPVREVVTDDNPGSPTRYGGPMGHLPDFFSSPLISDSGQAVAAGRAKLARSIGLARTRSVTVPVNPALEGGDVLAIAVDGEPVEIHIADSFDIPVTSQPPDMTIDTRSAEVQ